MAVDHRGGDGGPQLGSREAAPDSSPVDDAQSTTSIDGTIVPSSESAANVLESHGALAWWRERLCPTSCSSAKPIDARVRQICYDSALISVHCGPLISYFGEHFHVVVVHIPLVENIREVAQESARTSTRTSYR